jgi:peptidoglycan/xylan/chitin deacetylase (PgdA/CDA1 family)
LTETVLAHAVAGEPGSRLAALLDRRQQLADMPGAFAPIVVGVSGPAAMVREAQRGVPPGRAQAEAVLVRLRRQGVRVEFGEPLQIATVADLVELCRERGASSARILRADPSLVPYIQLGGWFAGGWKLRAARRATHRFMTQALAPSGLLGVRALELVLQAAFWSGARGAASRREWLRLTRSSYTALYYHQIAQDDVGRLNVPPSLFDAQLRLLRLFRFRPVSPSQLLAFHASSDAVLPRRSYVVTADDGFRDAVVALSGAGGHTPQLFVPTGLVGARAPWAAGAPLADWEELAAAAAAGVAVGSHTRTHAVLPGADGQSRIDELAGSLTDLRSRVGEPLPVLAYPYGREDAATRAAAAAAGYAAAYTTRPGRNSAWSDPFRLSRVGVKQWDSALSFLWKVTTGELLPRPWERWRRWRFERRVRAKRSSPRP